MKYTENCIHCLKPAAVWTGYVVSASGDVMAGWCLACREADEKHRLPGFMGRYTTALGKRSDPSGSLTRG